MNSENKNNYQYYIDKNLLLKLDSIVNWKPIWINGFADGSIASITKDISVRSRFNIQTNQIDYWVETTHRYTFEEIRNIIEEYILKYA